MVGIYMGMLDSPAVGDLVYTNGQYTVSIFWVPNRPGDPYRSGEWYIRHMTTQQVSAEGYPSRLAAIAAVNGQAVNWRDTDEELAEAEG